MYEIVLLALGSPLWLSLGIAAAAVLFALYVSLWSVLVALWTIGGALAVCAVGSVPTCIVFVAGGSSASGAALLSAGMVCAELAIFMVCGCKTATKGTILLYQKGGSIMSRTTKIWLITAASLVLVGCVLFVGVMSTLAWDFAKLSTVRYETNTHEVGEAFDNISLTTDTADIVFALSQDGKCTAACYEEENARHTVTIEENTLKIKIVQTKSWYDYIGFYFGTPKITVYLPKTEYLALCIGASTGNVEIPAEYSFENVDISLNTGDIRFCASVSASGKMKTTTGNIRIENTSVGSLALSATTGRVTASKVTCAGVVTVGVSTGEAHLTDVICESGISTGSTGNITLNHVIAAEKISIERTAGNVQLNHCDAAEVYVKITTGDVTGHLLSNKKFVTDTGTGSIDVPATGDRGRCEIITGTGDVQMAIKQF